MVVELVLGRNIGWPANPRPVIDGRLCWRPSRWIYILPRLRTSHPRRRTAMDWKMQTTYPKLD